MPNRHPHPRRFGHPAARTVARRIDYLHVRGTSGGARACSGRSVSVEQLHQS